ncbi:MAG: hypothetical protein HKP58_04330 [Desulfatitalea sp.]|nr:hypothetical protein [Desulfatitalea sp.]NNJ99618.1 hypothetical protein [Desulfatitalea sp.]
MGWFKIENSDLLIADSVLDSTTRFLKQIFDELDISISMTHIETLLSLTEDLLHKDPLIEQQKAERIINNTLTYRAITELPDEIKEQIQQRMKENIQQIINNYQSDLGRSPTIREVLSVVVVAIGAFSKRIGDPTYLNTVLDKIKRLKNP